MVVVGVRFKSAEVLKSGNFPLRRQFLRQIEDKEDAWRAELCVFTCFMLK